MKLFIFLFQIMQTGLFQVKNFLRGTKYSYLLILPLILPFFSLAAQYKSLDWNSIQVEATLKNNGNLKIAETQSILFTGDWNGAYRKFDLGLGQKLKFHSMEILRNNGEWETLSDDSIDIKDSYLYYPSESTVKWRSRYPHDPIFEGETIIYRLNYEYENILDNKSANVFQLNHDFGFEDRNGEIRKFKVNLSWEDKWKLVSQNNLQVLSSETEEKKLSFTAPTALQPGQKMIVTSDFDYNGDISTLNQISVLAVYGIRISHFILLLSFAGMVSFFIYLYCKQKGFFKEPKKIKSWEEFREFLGDLLPEEIAILSEKGLVASWMARMILEKKIQFFPSEKQESRLKLLVDRSSLSESDAKIIESLFVEGVTSISISELKKFYKRKKTSYSLAESIRSKTNQNLIAKGILPEHQSFFGKIIEVFLDKIVMNVFFFFLLVIGVFFIFKFFIEPILEVNFISGGRFFFFIFLFFFSRLMMSLFNDDHYGFYDLKYNRVRYFLIRYLLSMIPSLLIFAFYFWSLDLSVELYSILLGLAGLSILEYLWNTNPLKHMKQIEISLCALSMKNFLDAKLISDEPCDIPQEYASYIPAFDLEFDVKYRIEDLRKPDCLYLLPQYFDNWQEVMNQYQKNQTSQSNRHSSNTNFTSAENSSSSDSGISYGVATGLALGGLFGGAGASASWSEMSEFSSSAQYSPPSSSSSSSGSSSSGGGGGGGW
ncbi:MAG: DUF2207 domain-containing protein [Leptospira sp.]|nr:DUF2207 domain-containing protein [Leptospira sp.]NCS94423.1 DUF2207 domain-containing protein [Leptospira sp.]